MANHRRLPPNNGASDNGRLFQEWVIGELKAQREELKAQRESQRRMLGMLGDVARVVDRLSRVVDRLGRNVDTRLRRLEGGVAEILRRLPPKAR